jgi:hypothetical protein
MYAAKKAMMRPSGIPISSPLHPDLVAMYTMDNISGATLVDESPNNLDGTITGAVAVSGKLGNALRYDGVNDRTDIDTDWDAALGTEYEFNFWMDTLSDVVGTETFLAFTSTTGATTDNLVQCTRTSAANVRFFLRGSDRLNAVQVDVVDNVSDPYANFSVQRDGNTLTVYKNGVFQATNTSAGLSGFVLGRLTLGAVFENASNTWLGFANIDQDQLRIYNRKLTDAERATLNNSGSGI